MIESELPGLNGDRIIDRLGRQLGDAHVRIAQLEDVIATLVEREAGPSEPS